MKKLILLLVSLFIFQSCDKNLKTQPQNIKIKNIKKPNNIKLAKQKPNKNNTVIFKDTFAFDSYNDNGDYQWLYATKQQKNYIFVNDNNNQRNLLRGDICQIQWKKDTIYIAGDGETPDLADWLISIKKIQDGKVSNFRKNYKKQLKYHYFDQSYSQQYLDDLYLMVEYYICNSKNKGIKLAIQNNEALEFSIESTTENNRNYEVLGIGYTFEHRFTIIQWLYIDTETQKIYEYDLPNEKLIEFIPFINIK